MGEMVLWKLGTCKSSCCQGVETMILYFINSSILGKMNLSLLTLLTSLTFSG